MCSRQQLIDSIAAQLAEDVKYKWEIILSSAMKNCTLCRYWSNDAYEYCKLYNMKPPISVAVKGCDTFEDIETVPY